MSLNSGNSKRLALKSTKTIYVKLPAPIPQHGTCTGCQFRIADAVLLAEVKTEEDRIKVFQDHGVLLKEKMCPYCNNPCSIYMASHSWRCNRTLPIKRKRKRCDFDQSMYKNTWLSNVKLTTGQVLHFMALWCSESYNVKLVQAEIGLSQKSICDWNGFCLEAIEIYMTECLEKLGGPGKIVEVAEARFGKVLHGRDQDLNGQWVLGGIERESKKIFMVPLENRNSETLMQVILDWVLPGTTIMADRGKDLSCLQEYGYNYVSVGRSVPSLSSSSVVHTQNIRRKWRDVRESVPKYGNRYSISSYITKFLFFQKYDNPLYRLHHLLTIVGKLYNPNVKEEDS